MNCGKLLEEVYSGVGLVALRRVATSGSISTVVDTGWANKRGDGFYAQGANGGHVLFISETTDDGAPVNQFGIVSTYTLSSATPTWKLGANLGAAVGAGDVFTLAKSTIPLYEMLAQINKGMRAFTIQLQDTSLTITSNTLDYDIPLAAKGYPLIKVEVGNDTDGWADANTYGLDKAAAGVAGQLNFSRQPRLDDTIKITYERTHPELSAYNDIVHESIPDELAIAVCIEKAYTYLMTKRPGSFSDKNKVSLLADLRNQAEKALARHRVNNTPATLPRRHALRDM